MINKKSIEHLKTMTFEVLFFKYSLYNLFIPY